jgi:lactate permease
MEVSPVLWLAALAPLAAILILLLGFNWKAATAAPVGYFIAVLAAFTLFQASPRVIALQTVKGVWDALFILYIIAPALLLYQISKEAGAFHALRRGLESYTPNDLLHVLAFGWVFASFLQGITGFGAPIAVTAPLLVVVGVRPLWAVVIPLIGHAWANTFGTLAVAWNGLTLVTEPRDPVATALIAAITLGFANLLAGFSIAWLFGRGRGVREALPAVLIISGIHALGQIALAPFAPELANFLPGTVGLIAILLLARSRWYTSPTEIRDSQVMQEGESGADREENVAREKKAVGEEFVEMPLTLALSPYFVLIGLIVVVLLIPPVRAALSAFRIGLPFPALQTGLGIETAASDAYSPLVPLTHPGTFLLVSAVFAFIVFRRGGEIRPGRIGAVGVSTIKSVIPSAMALFALIPLATVMEGAGQTMQLALGIATVASAPVYAFLSPFIGAIGSFMTSSNLSSNILFGPLQDQTASALDIAQPAVLGGQTAGAAIGNSVAPGNVLLGAGAVGLSGQVGLIIRRVFFYTLTGLVLAGIIAFLAA